MAELGGVASQGHVYNSSVLNFSVTRSFHYFGLGIGVIFAICFKIKWCIITKILNQNSNSLSFKRAGIQLHLPQRYRIQEPLSQHWNVHILFNVLFHFQISMLKNFHTGRTAAEQDSDNPSLLIWLSFAHFSLIWLMLKWAINNTPWKANLKVTTF